MSAHHLNGSIPRSDPGTSRPEPRASRPRFGRRRAARRRDAGAAAAEQARAELLLLREENARLKAAPHQLPSFDRMVDQARSLLLADGDTDAASDDVTEMLVELIVVRESLAAVCEELERSLAVVRAKLDRIGAEAAPRDRDGRVG
jgi:hypothetical protein